VDEKEQKFTIHIDSDIPKSLIGDDQRLAQVITNLIANSVKFTPNGGSISLNTSCLDEKDDVCTILIEITDTGIGISPEQQASLFTSFQQAENNTTRKYGGTGLGLAISKNIVEMMGGKIWIESELDKGSTFIFTVQVKLGEEKRQDLSSQGIPAINEASGEGRQQAKEEYPNVDGIFAKHCILLAEDVEINREIVLALLEPTLINIDCAGNGVEAVRMFSEVPEKYDMIFMDVQMPEMGGYEATRRIRELDLPNAKTIPIIAMTANVFREDIEMSIESGMNGHIGKPLDYDKLLAQLRTYLPSKVGT